MAEEEFSPEETGSFPALARAMEWVRLVFDRNLTGAWPRTRPDLRLSLAQGYLLREGVVTLPAPSWADVLAAGIADGGGPLWQAFSQWRLDRWLGFVFAEDLPDWSLLVMANPVGPDLELVTFVDPAGGTEPGELATVHHLVMGFEPATGWGVAGIGRCIARPGWPPTDDEVPWLDG